MSRCIRLFGMPSLLKSVGVPNFRDELIGKLPGAVA